MTTVPYVDVTPERLAAFGITGPIAMTLEFLRALDDIIDRDEDAFPRIARALAEAIESQPGAVAKLLRQRADEARNPPYKRPGEHHASFVSGWTLCARQLRNRVQALKDRSRS